LREIRAKIPAAAGAAAATECCFVLQQVHLLSLSVMCPHTFPFSFLFAPFATTTTTTTFFSFSLFDNQNYLGYLARLCLVEIKRSSIIRWENRSQFFCFVLLFSGHR
jgi:hypothetical protein